MIELTEADRELLAQVRQKFGVVPQGDQLAVQQALGRLEQEGLVKSRMIPVELSLPKAYVVKEWRLTKLGREVLGKQNP